MDGDHLGVFGLGYSGGAIAGIVIEDTPEGPR